MDRTKIMVLLLVSFLLFSHSSCDHDLNFATLFAPLLSSSSSFLFDTIWHAGHEDHEPEFSYDEDSGRGPSKWGELDPSWKACGDGKSQSPIDLADQDVQVGYCPRQLQIAYKPACTTIRNTGHEIMISWKGSAGKIIINGTKYKLVQGHWHQPTEHSINGRRFDLEFHMVHTSHDGEVAVIGFLYRTGKPDSFLSKLLPFITSVTTEEKYIGRINPAEIGSFSGKYYRYMGSLTTPPCTEGVVWTVFRQVRTASEEQLQALIDGLGMNARPIQALNGRSIRLCRPWHAINVANQDTTLISAE